MIKEYLNIILLTPLQDLSMNQILKRYFIRIGIPIFITLLSYFLILSINIFLLFIFLTFIILLVIKIYNPIFLYFNDCKYRRWVKKHKLNYLLIVSDDSISDDFVNKIFKNSGWYILIDLIIYNIYPERRVREKDLRKIGIFFDKCFKNDLFANMISRHLGKVYGLYYDKKIFRLESFIEQYSDCFLYEEEEFDECLRDYSEVREICVYDF